MTDRPMTEEELDRSLLHDRDGDGKLWWPVGYVPLWKRRHDARMAEQADAH